MPSLTRTQARTLARQIAADDGTLVACTDSQVNLYIEEARQWYASMFQEDTVLQAASVSLVQAETTLAVPNVFRSLDFAHITDGVNNAVYPIERREVAKVALDVAADNAASVTPVAATLATSWAAYRKSDSQWALLVHPKMAAGNLHTIEVWGHAEFDPITSDATVLGFGHQGSRVIARLAALEVARASGRPGEFLANIASQLPERVVTRRADLARLLAVQPGRT